jgi:hypothetical protein
MTFVVGLTPGRVYTETDVAQGKCPGLGTVTEAVGNANTGGAITDIASRANGGDVRQYILLKITSAINLVNGNIVQYTGDYVATLPGSAGAGVPNLGPLAVVVASITASISQFVWCQIQGLANVLFEATTSAIPGAPVKLGGTLGQITAAAITTASSYISGIQVAATVSAVGLGAVLLNYPRVISG